MKVEFVDKNLDRLEIEPRFTAGYSPAVVRAFRKVMQNLRAARDERDLYAIKSLRFEKLKGNLAHQRSVRLNDQWRLLLELKEESPGKIILVVKIIDYH